MIPLLWLYVAAHAAEPEASSEGAAPAVEEAPSEADESPSSEEAPPPSEEPATIALPDAPALPSALDDASSFEIPEGEPVSVLDLWRAGRREVWSARTWVRPLLSLRVDPAARPTQLGLAIGRQWWQLREGAKATIEVVASGEAALASGRGSWTADLAVLGGTSVGPVGLQVGPSIVGDRTLTGAVDLGTVAALAPVAAVTVDLRAVQLVGGLAPRWFVAGSRASAQQAPLPLGDEPVVRAGIGVKPGALRLTADWTGRWTAAGRFDRYGMGLRVRL